MGIATCICPREETKHFPHWRAGPGDGPTPTHISMKYVVYHQVLLAVGLQRFLINCDR